MKTKIKLSITLIALCLVQFSFAQWTQMANYPGGPIFTSGFSIGNKAYLISGQNDINFYNAVYEYDITTNIWTQKANFPGNPRSGAIGFSINNKGYFGLGENTSSELDDIWEYDPTNDTWIQKTTFPGGERSRAFGFTIGNKGYVGGGYDFSGGANSSSIWAFDDFWEYDPIANTWMQKTSVPNISFILPGRAGAVGIGLNNKGYVGMGNSADSDYFNELSDFWEYSPVSNTWVMKTSLPGAGRSDAGIFTYNNEIYVVGGVNYTSGFGFNTVRKFNPITGLWTNASNFGGGLIFRPVALTFSNNAFVGTGSTGSFDFGRDDWWRFGSVTTSVVDMDESDVNISSYPNPVKDELTIHLKNQQAFTTAKLKVLSVDGKVIYETMVSSSIMNHSIDLSSYASGLYIVELKSDDFFYTKKIIKE